MGTHYAGGWVGLGDGLDGSGKSQTLPRFETLTVQPVLSVYIDCRL
jgi:hypothetical protein